MSSYQDVEVKTGEFRVARGDSRLLTRGVGSCVVVCVWDHARTMGGMAHIPMPSSAAGTPDEALRAPGLFADTALPELIRLMEREGVCRQNLSVRLIGAGNMFAGGQGDFMNAIPRNLLHGATQVVQALGLHVAAQSVGGTFGRSVSFNVRSGLININLTNGDVVAL